MATIRAYTTIEQSRKLAEILPLETADMYYSSVPVREWKDKTDKSKGIQLVFKDQIFAIENLHNHEIGEGDIYAWSLASLIGVIPKGEYIDFDLSFGGYQGVKYIDEWFCSYEKQSHSYLIEVCHAPTTVDACYEMILKLHELKLL